MMVITTIVITSIIIIMIIITMHIHPNRRRHGN